MSPEAHIFCGQMHDVEDYQAVEAIITVDFLASADYEGREQAGDVRGDLLSVCCLLFGVWCLVLRF